MTVLVIIIAVLWWAIVHWYITLPVLIVMALIGSALEQVSSN